jgi:RimJ/RimL family protein N-acetyltransferase
MRMVRRLDDMASPEIRDAVPADIAAICRFGEEHIPPLYTPLIGEETAREQLRFWTATQITRTVTRGLVVVAEAQDGIVGVGQRGRRDPATDSEHVIYKLYLHPDFRGHGIGPRLTDALIARMNTDKVHIEHFAANVRAGAFYEREGFAVERAEQDIVWRSRAVTHP